MPKTPAMEALEVYAAQNPLFGQTITEAMRRVQNAEDAADKIRFPADLKCRFCDKEIKDEGDFVIIEHRIYVDGRSVGNHHVFYHADADSMMMDCYEQAMAS